MLMRLVACSQIQNPAKAQEQNCLHKVALAIHNAVHTYTVAHMFSHTHTIYNIHSINKAEDIQVYIIIEGAKGKSGLLKR